MKKSHMIQIKSCFGKEYNLTEEECINCQFQKKCKSFTNSKKIKIKNRNI